MKTLFTAWIAVISLLMSVSAQTVTFKGTVTDKQHGRGLADVNITIVEQGFVCNSNDAGEFQCTLSPTNSFTLRFEKLGYRTQTVTVTGNTQTIQIALEQTNISFGEVVISSTKYDQLLKESPLPIAVVSPDKIAGGSYNGVSDVISSEPGISLVRDGMWGTDVNIRGLSRQNVVTLVDGNRIETASNHAASLSLVDIMDVDHIEIIKGGISTLYGTGATGGVVSITTKRPHFTEKFTLSGNAGSAYNSANNGAAGYLSLITSADFWFAKASVTARSAENVRTPSGILKNSYFRDKNYSATLGFKPLNGHKLTVDFQRFHGEDIGIPGGRSFPATAVARYTEASRTMYSAEYSVRDILPSLVNTSLKYFHQVITRSVELRPTDSTKNEPSADHTAFGVQLLTNWMFSEKSQAIAGADYWQRTYDGIRLATLRSKSGNVTITADLPVPHSTYKSTGVFAQHDFKLFNDNLKLSTGFRYDFIHVSNDDAMNPLYQIKNGVYTYPPKNAKTSFPANSDDDKSWSANIGVLYKVFPNIDLTLNASHAFRSPVLEERYQYIFLGGDTLLGNPNLNPEIGNFLDAGIRIWGENLSVQGSLFYNSFSDLVTDKLVSTKKYVKTNIGEAALYGFDFSAEYAVLSNLACYTTASYVRGEDTKNNANLGQIPPFNGITGVKYHLPELLSIDCNAAWTSTQNNTAVGELKTGGYTIFNATISSEEYSFGYAHGKLHLGCENIFDREYRDHLASTRGLIKSEPGRNVFVKLSLHW